MLPLLISIFVYFIGQNTAYEEPCTASMAGSGGSKSGGGVIYVTTERLMELEGSLDANAYSYASAGQGGGSGGTISITARYVFLHDNISYIF